jgi:hypothetical protein
MDPALSNAAQPGCSSIALAIMPGLPERIIFPEAIKDFSSATDFGGCPSCVNVMVCPRKEPTPTH